MCCSAQQVPAVLYPLTNKIFVTYNALVHRPIFSLDLSLHPSSHFHCVCLSQSTERGKFALDNSPETLFAREPLNARMYDIHVCLTTNVKDVLHCLGGIDVLFPLFAQLDQPYQLTSRDYKPDYTMCSQVRMR